MTQRAYSSAESLSQRILDIKLVIESKWDITKDLSDFVY